MMRVATLILSALALALLAFDLVLGPAFWGILLVIPLALPPFPISAERLTTVGETPRPSHASVWLGGAKS